MKNKKGQPRHNARRYALQALYQWHYAQPDVGDVARQFAEENSLDDADADYFNELVVGTIKHVNDIDQHMRSHLDREIAVLNPVELSVLRVAIFELMYRVDIPYKVVINEALELAKEFGAQDGHRYVNAVLDAVVSTLPLRKGK